MARDSQNEALNKAIIENAFNAWRAGTGGPFDLLAEKASWTIVGHSRAAKTYPNREAFMREVIRPFNARMRERLIPTVLELVAADERVVIRFDAEAIALDGLPYMNSYAWFLTIRDGRIVAATAFFDSIAFDELWTRVPPQSSTAELHQQTHL